MLDSGLLAETHQAQQIWNPVQAGSEPSVFHDIQDPVVSFRRPYEDERQEVILPTGGRLYMRLIPPRDYQFSPEDALELASTGSLAPMRRQGDPLGGMSRRNVHGAIVIADLGDPNVAWCLTQLMKNGELWGIDSHIVNLERIRERHPKEAGNGYIATQALEEILTYTLAHYLNFMSQTLQASPPLKLIAGLTGVEGYLLAVRRSLAFGGRIGEFVEDQIEFEQEIEVPDLPPEELLLPFFEFYWRKAGANRPSQL